MTFGEHLIALFRERNLSPGSLGECLLVDAAEVDSWCHDKALPSSAQTIRLAEVLGLPFESLQAGLDLAELHYVHHWRRLLHRRRRHHSWRSHSKL